MVDVVVEDKKAVEVVVEIDVVEDEDKRIVTIVNQNLEGISAATVVVPEELTQIIDSVGDSGLVVTINNDYFLKNNQKLNRNIQNSDPMWQIMM